ncbi:endolytic transglycosylase MltG [Desulfotomaculum varum]
MVMKWQTSKRVLAVTFLLLVAGLFWYFSNLLSPVKPSGQAPDVLIHIAPSSSTAQIAKTLQQQGMIRNATAFRLYARYQGLDNQVKAGYYMLNASMSAAEILNLLVQGKTAGKSFTIPEGYTLKQITESLAAKGYIREQLFKDQLKSGQFKYSFIKDLPPGDNRLEGYLFPETYTIPIDSDEKHIINIMLAGMDRQIKELKLADKAKEHNLTLHQVVTIASMIEREARVERDRPLISSVIHNRLRAGMKLQIDATVEYALGERREKIYYKDLEVASPYNTYQHYGLPPGPIASPGRASLLAAVNPARTNYYYYVAKPDGSHAFAVTYAEHNANKIKYLK